MTTRIIFMANINEQDQSVSSVEDELVPTHSPVKPEKTCSFLNYFSVLLALLALIFAGYSWYCMQKTNRELKVSTQKLTTHIQGLKQQNQLFEEGVSDSFQKANKAIEEKVNALSKQIQVIGAQKSNDNQEWLLLKIRYYLELAKINAHWSINSKDESSKILLQKADTLLANINNPKLFKMRQIIAKEIQQLKSLETIDLPGLLSQLDALENQLSELTIQVPSLNTRSKEQSQSDKPNPSWDQSLQSSFKVLKSLVVVRRNNEEIKPLLSPIYESVLKESVRLNLQEAQWALITHNTTAYQFALNQALVNIKRGFNNNQQKVASLINKITELQKVNLLEKKPTVGEALPLINQLIEENQLAKPETTANVKGE